jgi:hypothetical protein
MKKAGTNAKWHGLSPAKLKTLEGWLFDEKMNYETALARARKELGFDGSLSSLKRFYQRRTQERMLEDFTEARENAQAIGEAPGSARVLRAAGMKLVSRLFLKRVMASPEDAKQWEPLAKLLLASEDTEVRRELKTEENRIRRECLELATRRFQYDSMVAAHAAFSEFQAREKALKEKGDPYAWGKTSNAIRTRLFGKDVPDLLPENAQEEAAMKAAEAEREAELQRERAERARQVEQDRARLREEAERRQMEAEAAPVENGEKESAPSEEPGRPWQDTEPNHFPFNDARTVDEWQPKMKSKGYY